jgi:hypothetical protein
MPRRLQRICSTAADLACYFVHEVVYTVYASQRGAAPCRIPAKNPFHSRKPPGQGQSELPFTRRLLCQLSYTGGRLAAS